jgi:hypothetical protein
MVFSATFNNISVISWQSVLLVEETGIPGENHYLYIYIYLKSLNNLHKNLYINFRTLRPCGLPQRKFITYMKNKQHDVTKEIKEFITLISRNFVYEKSMSIQFCA